VAELLGVCKWCTRDIVWDRTAGGWRHVESRSLLCPDGSWAAIDNDASPISGKPAQAGPSACAGWRT